MFGYKNIFQNTNNQFGSDLKNYLIYYPPTPPCPTPHPPNPPLATPSSYFLDQQILQTLCSYRECRLCTFIIYHGIVEKLTVCIILFHLKLSIWSSVFLSFNCWDLGLWFLRRVIVFLWTSMSLMLLVRGIAGVLLCGYGKENAFCSF